MDDVRIRYQGFSPSDFTKSYFNEVLERIYEEAPASSFVKATISKVREGYRAVVQVNSGAGDFFATAFSHKVTDLGHEVVSKMHRQFDRWKTRRRDHETVRDPLWWKAHTMNDDEVSYEKKYG